MSLLWFALGIILGVNVRFSQRRMQGVNGLALCARHHPPTTSLALASPAQHSASSPVNPPPQVRSRFLRRTDSTTDGVRRPCSSPACAGKRVLGIHDSWRQSGACSRQQPRPGDKCPPLSGSSPEQHPPLHATALSNNSIWAAPIYDPVVLGACRNEKTDEPFDGFRKAGQ
jgi:hypothetical protein